MGSGPMTSHYGIDPSVSREEESHGMSHVLTCPHGMSHV
jgi:hypothetical protein